MLEKYNTTMLTHLSIRLKFEKNIKNLALINFQT